MLGKSCCRGGAVVNFMYVIEKEQFLTLSKTSFEQTLIARQFTGIFIFLDD